MIELNDRLAVLRESAREWAAELRGVSLEIDGEPTAISKYPHLGAFGYLRQAMIPAEYKGDGCRIGRYRFNGLELAEVAVALEELGAGDAGLVFGAPGPSLSGVLIHELADRDQKDAYYRRMLERPRWTFFALTEVERGSDAASLRTALIPVGDADGGMLLNGAKCYIGNASRADFGVVFARRAAGPLGVTAVLVDTSMPGFRAEVLPTIGLRAMPLTVLTFDNVKIPPQNALGKHLPPSRRGLWGAVRTFNRARVSIAATALGVSRAALDYVRSVGGPASECEFDRLSAKVTAVRHLVHQAARAADADPRHGALASAAKASAARLAEDATTFAARALGAGALLDHPLLDKWTRDARAFEFMEGTTHIQHLNLAASLLKGRPLNAGLPEGTTSCQLSS